MDGNLDDHWSEVDQILSRLATAGLRLDPKNFESAKKEIKNPGFIISKEEGIKVDSEKVKATVAWGAPSNVRGVRIFLGSTNFWRTFIADFIKISAPLQGITTKGTPFCWEKQQRGAIDKFKLFFSTAPLLAP